MRIRFLSMLLAGGLAANSADLPVKQVTLYKHGIGFFEREGTVAAGEEVRLDFKNGDMNDVLKSLIVFDANGGKISGIRYDSNATLEQQLSKYPFVIGNMEMLSAFLDRIKGARLEVTVGDGKQTGVILGARAITTGARGNREVVNEEVTLLTDSGAMANFDLAGVKTLQLLDAHLQEQLKQYLQTVAQANAKDKRSVYVDASGAGNRSLRLSYITPVAIWKSSYRLSLEAGANSRLEGWAIVDNTTDEDWNGVKLAVVSGRPISFISLLDTPRYGNRQVAELPEDRAAGPVVYGGAIGTGNGAGMGGAIGGMPASAPVTVPGAGLNMGERMETPAMRFAPETKQKMRSVQENLAQSSVAGATGATLGELFEYSFAGPVTIRKNQSAMLPFLQDKIAVRKLLIYKGDEGEHPVNAAEVTNTTAKTLDGGPITVYDDGAYAGEALVETFKAGDKRLIGYAVDYGTRVETNSDEGDQYVREISAKNGVLHIRYAERDETTYTIKNVDAKAKTLIVQQADAGFKLLAPKPLEKTADAYRFEVHLPANGQQELKVELEKVTMEETAVTSATPDALTEIVQNKQLSESGRKQLAAIVDLKGKIAEAQANLDGLTNRNNQLTEEQNRLRQNIGSLNEVKGQEEQVRQYASRLGANETELAKLRDERDAEARRKKGLEAELRSAIEKLEF